MKLWIDGQCFQSSSRARGIGRYAIELVRALAQLRPDYELHISLNSNSLERAALAHDRLRSVLPKAQIHTWHGIEDGGEGNLGFTNHIQLSGHALLHHVTGIAPDIALSISPFEGMSEPFSPFLPPPQFGIPSAAVFYDAIPKRLASIYLNSRGARSAYNRRLKGLANVNTLLAISEYSKNEAEEIVKGGTAVNIGTGLHPEFLNAIELPVSKSVQQFITTHRTSILYVGGLDYRKNLPRAIEAISALPEPVRSNVELIIVGVKHEEELSLLRLDWARCGLDSDQIRLFGFASDEELAGFYNTVDIVLQPSLLEGFGLTALEALACGTPVLASNTGALPEVVGEALLMFDPESVQSISSRILWAINHKLEINELAKQASARAQRFTWLRVAKRASLALDKIAAANPFEQSSVVENRRAIAKNLGDLTYSIRDAATVLAASEPQAPKAPKFLVDITSTARVDHKSGIQRVVRKMCDNLLQIAIERHTLPPTLIGTDSPDGFFPTRLDGGPDDWDARRSEKILIGKDDTLLMLDSSWEFYSQHQNTLRNARINGTKIISVMYDLVPAMTPAFCDPGMPTVFVPWLKSCLIYSDGIVCISKAVADELIRVLVAIDFPRQINVGYWHLGADFSEVEGESTKPIKQIANSFLSVGTIEPRKGHDVTLAAFEKLWEEGVDVCLTLVGRIGWGVDSFVEKLQSHPELGKRLHWHPKVDDTELKQIYSRNSALIAASYGEGFGLPIIEAAHHGLPVIASDLEVFKEVAAGSESVSFFSVGDSRALYLAIKEYVRNPVPYEDKGGLKFQTWKQSAERLHNIVWDNEWYYSHTPSDHAVTRGGGYFGELEMSRPLSPKARSQYVVEPIGHPTLLPLTKEIRIMVRVKNLSDYVWGPPGSTEKSNGVVLAAMLVDDDGELIGDNAIRVPVTFMVPPGGQIIQSILIPLSKIENGAASAIIDMMQIGVGIFGAPIEVSLLDWAEFRALKDREAFQASLTEITSKRS